MQKGKRHYTGNQTKYSILRLKMVEFFGLQQAGMSNG